MQVNRTHFFICCLFFISGIPALLYQLVWERSLLVLFGLNVEAVTITVAAFILGLGLGSFLGGLITEWIGKKVLLCFAAIECCIGIFGCFSLMIFAHMESHVINISNAQSFFLAFALIILPTLLMGASLPLLVSDLIKRIPNVGYNVGILYFVNTLGSSFACVLVAHTLMRQFGQSGVVEYAVTLNFIVALSSVVLAIRLKSLSIPVLIKLRQREHLVLPFSFIMLFGFISGFIALSYEILWVRIFAFASGGSAPSFALVLAYYLFGIAFGALCASQYCNFRTKATLTPLVWVLIGMAICGFLAPLGLLQISFVTAQNIMFAFILPSTFFFGFFLPVLADIGIAPNQQSGLRVGVLYFASTIGACFGSILTGFFLMDIWSTATIIVFLSVLSCVLAFPLLWMQKITVKIKMVSTLFLGALIVLLFKLHMPWYQDFYARLLAKTTPTSFIKKAMVVENRQGVVVVNSDGYVYGGGIYDGQLNTNIKHDTNWLFRPYFISAMHPHPQKILMIGLSGGAWAEVIAQNPDVQNLTIVEINPGYQKIIKNTPQIVNIFSNPKVHIVWDDGRRWLRNHPQQKFDMIVMNTTYYWREHSSNLLSMEMLNLAKQHLLPGGILYFNTTGSLRVVATALASFPYAIRVYNMIAVSETPIHINRQHWKDILLAYRLDGVPVFDMKSTQDQRFIAKMLAASNELNDNHPRLLLGNQFVLESEAKDHVVITDNNMGDEWFHQGGPDLPPR